MSSQYGTKCQVSFWTNALNSYAIAIRHFSSLEAYVYEVGSDSLQSVCKDKILRGMTMVERDRICMDGMTWGNDG